MTYLPRTAASPTLTFTLLVLSLVAGGGCAQSRTVVITTKPPDAMIRVAGVERGRGRVVQKLEFTSPGQAHSVVASRPGYKEEEAFVTLDTPADPAIVLALKPLTRRVTINVSPVPAQVMVDDKPMTADPVSQVSPELEFTLDPRNQWTGHTVVARRKGWQDATARITWTDKSPSYELRLEPLKKNLKIRTNPAGAQVFIDGQTLGASPVEYAGYPFPVDPDTGEFVPHRVRVTNPGYDDVEQAVSWDNGQTEYVIDLTAKSKPVRIVTDPPGAVVKVDGLELSRDPTGASTHRLQFPPVDKDGNLKTYTAVVSKPPGDRIWESKELTIGWEGGKKEYAVALREIRTRSVPLVRWRPERQENAWRLAPESLTTVALKDVNEGPPRRGVAAPFRVMEAPQGWSVDSLSVSPDGTQIAYGLVGTPAAGVLQGRVGLVGADAAPGATIAADPNATELTPSFSADGGRVVFSSNRDGKRFRAWSASVGGEPGAAPAQLTDGESHDLWPSLDADPKPRVFYQALFDTRSQSRLYSVRIGGNQRTDLGEPGASQPRVGPKGDSVIFTLPDPKTGKRDVYQMPDGGGPTLNLTNTPDVDECDAVWSPDGGAIAVASDAGADDEGRRNYDIWIIDMKNPQRPRQVTVNGSWDDSPGWSPLGDAIYFRSNRGGAWAIWKVDLKQ